jgi:hypothetical protein
VISEKETEGEKGWDIVSLWRRRIGMTDWNDFEKSDDELL